MELALALETAIVPAGFQKKKGINRTLRLNRLSFFLKLDSWGLKKSYSYWTSQGRKGGFPFFFKRIHASTDRSSLPILISRAELTFT